MSSKDLILYLFFKGINYHGYLKIVSEFSVEHGG